MKNSKEKYVA